jgi:putative flippase GtrA
VTLAVGPPSARATQIAVAYCAFAACAMAVNLSAQWLVLHFGPHLFRMWRPLEITGAMAVGTGAGLVLKYVLDKRFIFQDPATGARAHAKRFSLYAAGGLFTTAIPYGLELVTGMAFRRGPAIYVAGAVGLVIGYAVKFQLDRRFVFNRP